MERAFGLRAFEAHRAGRRFALRLSTAWMLGVALASATFPMIASAAESAPKFLGAQSCSSSSCHGGAADKHNQNIVWAQRDFHTRAQATLTIGRSRLMMQALKAEDATTDPRCTVCHNPFQAVPASQKGPLVQALEGVSCESCHNAVEPWLLTHTRTDLTYAQKVSAGMRDLKNLYVRANTCVACHQNVDADVRRAAHPELTFELDGQCLTMPRHWPETNRLRGAQAWFVGQAVALREAAAQMKHGSASDEIKARANAIAFVLGVPAEHDAADDLARNASIGAWTAEEVGAQLDKLANRDISASGPALDIAMRAERTVLGLDRLTTALGLGKNTAVSAALNTLFARVQSRPDFDPRKFSTELVAFREVVNAASR